jgi:hypothetical protein
MTVHRVPRGSAAVMRGSSAVGEEAQVADADQALGQDVDEEASQGRSPRPASAARHLSVR